VDQVQLLQGGGDVSIARIDPAGGDPVLDLTLDVFVKQTDSACGYGEKDRTFRPLEDRNRKQGAAPARMMF